ncbi:MAG: dihydrofolate reductase [Oscillospiraceae bacterium]|nr:dihydrofolate reductase [Oscillospiraceae bacterium]
MTIILVMDNDFAIGKNGGLLYSLPLDMRHFRETTKGAAVVMGRKTYESFPKRPLPGRENIVLSRNSSQIEGATVFNDVGEMLSYVKTLDKKVFVIGGGEIYKLLLPYCGEAIITRVYDSFGGDVFFYDIENDKNWELVECSEMLETNGKNIRFMKFVKKTPEL